MIVKHECKKCGEKFTLVSGVNVIEVEEVLIKDERYDTMYYVTTVVCPHCGAEEVVQVDNEKTKEMLHSIVAKMRTICKTGKRTRRQSAQLKNLNKLLDNKRKKLKEEYDAKVAMSS